MLCKVPGVGGGALLLHLLYFEGSFYATLADAADEQPLLAMELQVRLRKRATDAVTDECFFSSIFYLLTTDSLLDSCPLLPLIC